MGRAVSNYIDANGSLVTDLDIFFPYYGIPVADIALSTGVALSSPVTLLVGNLTLTMAIDILPSGSLATQSFAGVTTARLVGGAGKWRTPMALAPYRAPPGTAGVLMSHVLSDIAKATGETVNVASGSDRTVGPFFVPETNAPASRILSLLAGSLWWIDAKGITQVASTRASTMIASFAGVEHVDGGKGWSTVSTEDPASWMPGASYTGPTAAFTVAATRMRVSGGGTMRLEVLTS